MYSVAAMFYLLQTKAKAISSPHIPEFHLIWNHTSYLMPSDFVELYLLGKRRHSDLKVCTFRIEKLDTIKSQFSFSSEIINRPVYAFRKTV